MQHAILKCGILVDPCCIVSQSTLLSPSRIKFSQNLVIPNLFIFRVLHLGLFKAAAAMTTIRSKTLCTESKLGAHCQTVAADVGVLLVKVDHILAWLLAPDFLLSLLLSLLGRICLQTRISGCQTKTVE